RRSPQPGGDRRPDWKNKPGPAAGEVGSVLRGRLFSEATRTESLQAPRWVASSRAGFSQCNSPRGGAESLGVLVSALPAGGPGPRVAVAAVPWWWSAIH